MATNEPTDGLVLTFRNAASILGVSVRTFRVLLERGSLPVIQLSDRRRGVLRSDLTAYINGQRTLGSKSGRGGGRS